MTTTTAAEWTCPREGCGCDGTWQACWSCGGDGSHDAYEDDPLWFAPGDREGCRECSGAGGWVACWQAVEM